MHPARVERAVVIAVGAAATAEQIALCSLQVRAIRADPALRRAATTTSSRAARRRAWPWPEASAQISYRTEAELGARFGREPQGEEQPLKGGRYAVESYLEHHGEKLVRRFDANSYVVLSEAMNHHDVGPGPGRRGFRPGRRAGRDDGHRHRRRTGSTASTSQGSWRAPAARAARRQPW